MNFHRGEPHLPEWAEVGLHCEIEFLPVGTKSKAGDAIVIRYGYDHDYRLMLVDGGIADTGDEIVTHLARHFGDHGSLEHVVLTHSDADHASGLRNVLKNVVVKNLWLHIPWLLAEDVRALFKDKRWTKDGLQKSIKDNYDIIAEIVDAAEAQGTAIHYAFAGDQIGPFTVLSPTRNNYLWLLPQLPGTPDPDRDLIEQNNEWIGKAPSSLIKIILDAAIAKVSKFIPESWYVETLRDNVTTSSSNETSVILYGQFDDNRKVLLTGDAGIKALTWAANYADANHLPLQEFTFVQIPHHGSRRNIGPTVLDRLVGPVQREGSGKRFSAFVSSPTDDDQHPRKVVLNAFIRRGGEVHGTQGVSKIHWGGFARRAGYSGVSPMPFSTEVEDYTE